MPTIYDFTVKDKTLKDYDLSQFKNKVVLIVNVASQCGLTPQYKGLEELHQKFKNNDFIILGFPCNQFGAQEPGSNDEIQSFCQLNYGVTFPILDKIEVNGKNTAPLYQYLKSNAPGILGTESIKWNFAKFLIGKDGNVIKRFAPQSEPSSLLEDIEAALK